MVDTTKPINSDWIIIILIVGWIIFSIVHKSFELMFFLSLFLVFLLVLGDSE